MAQSACLPAKSLIRDSQGMQMSEAVHSADTPLPLEEDPDDPIRFARNNWTAPYSHVSDSSAIIDSIDVDMIDATQESNTGFTEVYIVLDTNILIHHLLVLKQAVACIDASDSKLHVVLLVPGIVVSELDHLKSSTRGIAFQSRSASDWLAGEIGSGRGYVKGQAYTQTMLPSGDWRQRSGLTNDELILDCCKYFGHVNRKDVLLCTMDNNLVVHASSNAANLFARDVSSVIRPFREHWSAAQLLEQAVPGIEKNLVASIHGLGPSKRYKDQSSVRDYQRFAEHAVASQKQTPDEVSVLNHDGVMEVDMESLGSAGDRRDYLHRQICAKLAPELRKLTGQAAKLQQCRRQQESMYSPENLKFTGTLPTEKEWIEAWSLRECLRFLANIDPPWPRSWNFGEGEASSLADFLGSPGERGARRGREWAKHDWGRELLTVERLGRDFQIQELDEVRIGEYKYAVMEVFEVG